MGFLCLVDFIFVLIGVGVLGGVDWRLFKELNWFLFLFFGREIFSF